MTLSSTISETTVAPALPPDVMVSCRDVTVAYEMSGVGPTTLKESLISKLSGGQRSRTRVVLDGVNLTARRGECIALLGTTGAANPLYSRPSPGF